MDKVLHGVNDGFSVDVVFTIYRIVRTISQFIHGFYVIVSVISQFLCYNISTGSQFNII